jgi:hypothetical protein
VQSLGVARIVGTTGVLALMLTVGCQRPSTEAKTEAKAEADERPEPHGEPPARVGLVEVFEQATRDIACVDAMMLAHAVETYLLYKRACPPNVETLASAGFIARIPDSAPSWSIACSDDGPIVSAPGADGRLGTSDDLVHGGPRASCAR